MIRSGMGRCSQHSATTTKTSGSIHIRIRAQFLQRLLALAFVVHEIETLAVVALLDVTLGLEDLGDVAVPVALAAGLPERLQRVLTRLAQALEVLVLQRQEELAAARIALAGGAAD